MDAEPERVDEPLGAKTNIVHSENVMIGDDLGHVGIVQPMS